jgi:hypothetical protein
MRSRLIILAGCLLALAVPAKASAAVTVGISDNLPQVFTDPLFAPLHITHARVVVSWNVMTTGDDELGRVHQYVDAANAHGVDVLVAFQHARGDVASCKSKKNFKKTICKLPSTKDYERNIKLFFAAFPTVKLYSPWQEANHFEQPTSRDPKGFAKLTDLFHKDCKGCTLVIGDLLDQADDVTAKHPKFTQTIAWIKTFRKALKTPRTICGVHNYSDVNRFRQTGTQAVVKALGCKQIWLTETGGLYHFGSFWSKKTYNGCKTAASCQLKATKYLFAEVKREKTVKRVYIYSYFGGGTGFDSGLVANGVKRPAYDEVAKHT